MNNRNSIAFLANTFLHRFSFEGEKDAVSFLAKSDRVPLESYRFGAGTQEKDNEIYGMGNAYTAQYWEYDPRLGRRWNVDPVLKPNSSLYSTYSNRPITNVDPNGDDDFYDSSGKLLKRTPSGNAIYIINSSKAVFDAMYSNIIKSVNSKEISWHLANSLLSMYSTNIRDYNFEQNTDLARNIVWQYYLDLGYNPKKVQYLSMVEESDCECTAQSFGPPETYEFAWVDKRFLSYVQNSDDIKSLWNHEYYHRQLQTGSTDQDQTNDGRSVHLQAYYYEVSQPSFSSVSGAFRNYTIKNIEKYLNSIDESEFEKWKSKFEDSLDGKFTKNKKDQYEFKSN